MGRGVCGCKNPHFTRAAILNAVLTPFVGTMEDSVSQSDPQDAEGDACAGDAIRDDLFCPGCGYNLRSLTGERCPECAFDIREVRRRRSDIPWMYRDRGGVFRTYWKTVRMVVLQSRQFCMEIGRPVDEPSAWRFRRLTLLHAYLPLVVITLAVLLAGFVRLDAEVCAYLAVVHVGIIVCLAATTSLPYYLFRDPDLSLNLQRRGAVLMLYAGAPLALMFLVALLVIVGIVLPRLFLGNLDLVFYLAAGGFFAAILGAMIYDAVRMIRRLLGESRAAKRQAVKLIVLWCLVAALSLVGIPLAAGFLAVVWFSFH